MVSLMVAGGASIYNAEIAAAVHLDADMKGRGVQGLDYLPYTLNSLERGLIDGQAMPTIEARTASTAIVNGNRGMGQTAAVFASDLLIELTELFGAAAVSVRNSTDVFMLGYYAEKIAAAGLISFVFTSGPPLVHPEGGRERLLSTNPIAYGFPRKGRPPLVFDAATSAVSSSSVRQAIQNHDLMAEGSGIGPTGLPTKDPLEIRNGAISPMAGHRGFGLALMVGLLCGPLTGSGIGPELAGWQAEGKQAEGKTATQGHFVFALNPSHFGDKETIIERIEWYLEVLRNCTPLPGRSVRIPGERANELRESQSRDGVQVLRTTCSGLAPYAHRLRVPLPAEIKAALDV